MATNGQTPVAFQARNMPPAMPKTLHPAAQEAAAAWSDIMHANETLQAENGQLRADLSVERRHIADLQRMLDAKTAECHRAQRYAIEVRTHLKHVIKGAESVVAVALEADSCAMAFADEPVAPQQSRSGDPVAAVEKALTVVVGAQAIAAQATTALANGFESGTADR